jgi:hypothetical protein
MKKLKLAGIFVLPIVLATLAWGEVIARHPRVAELEDKLAKDASLYLKGRFPEVPFLVTVSISPLRRGDGYQKSEKGESLPYFESDSEELQDEWDDPQVSWGKLMMRVQKAALTISLPDSLNDDEVAEVKESLFKLLNLTPARDEIQIQRRAWSQGGHAWLYGAIGSIALFLLIAGLFFTGRSAARHVGDALTSAAKSQGSSGSAASSSGPVAASPTHSPEGGAGDSSRDVQFNDPIRVREVMVRMVQDLSTSTAFPTLDDMIDLDALGKKDPALLGAVLAEFSDSIRSKLFALSSNRNWLEALLNPGLSNFDCLEVLQKLTRRTRAEKRAAWEQLLVYVWRLGDERGAFLKKLTQEQAFAILGSMPKSISVEVGRKSFPGAWGVLLDPGFHPAALADAMVQKLSTEALAAKPLSDLTLLERYRHEIELIEYLKIADIASEREIYEAASSDSMIHSMRPPFYLAVDATEEILKDFVPKSSIDQWAMALFNAPRTERFKIEKQFSQKQRFLFVEKLKAFDAHNPEPTQVGSAKEAIARFFAEFSANFNARVIDLAKAKAQEETSEKTTEGTDDVDQKAAA